MLKERLSHFGPPSAKTPSIVEATESGTRTAMTMRKPISNSVALPVYSKGSPAISTLPQK